MLKTVHWVIRGCLLIYVSGYFGISGADRALARADNELLGKVEGFQEFCLDEPLTLYESSYVPREVEVTREMESLGPSDNPVNLVCHLGNVRIGEFNSLKDSLAEVCPMYEVRNREGYPRHGGLSGLQSLYYTDSIGHLSILCLGAP